MLKRMGAAALLIAGLGLLSGCGAIGAKEMSVSVIYGVTTLLACLILGGYLKAFKVREGWFLLLLSSVAVINGGYWLLSLAPTVEAALWANRLSYAGSVLLPLSMLMIILKTTGARFPRWLPVGLLFLSLCVFLITASPGVWNGYYASVFIEKSAGATLLRKVYGPWHKIYLFYLVGYFGALLWVIIRHARSDRNHAIQGGMLAAAVLVNLGVWLLEQLVRIDFEMLSVSYILSELFLIALQILRREEDSSPRPQPALEPPQDLQAYFESQLSTLTATEKSIYTQYVQGLTSRQIMENQGIKENTLKYHNKNIYAKLGVSSRKEMLMYAAKINTKEIQGSS
ncbi:MAG: hypothetical protein IJF65_03045 [Clostridia bacterium]|nr:hypothetical protein [Clostridia bacterium]